MRSGAGTPRASTWPTKKSSAGPSTLPCTSGAGVPCKMPSTIECSGANSSRGTGFVVVTGNPGTDAMRGSSAMMPFSSFPSVSTTAYTDQVISLTSGRPSHASSFSLP